MDILFVNNAKTLLDGAILVGATSLIVDDGSLFPSPTGGQYFYATLQNPADDTDYEIIKVTARSTNTLTITRAQEGTIAQTWASGILCEARLTAGSIDALKAHAGDHISGGSAELDGDKIDIDWSPAYYTPASTPTEVDAIVQLSAHLYGLDQAVKPSSQDARGTIEIATHAEAQIGSETGMAITPSSLTAVLKQQSWMQDEGYYIGTDTIRARDGDGLNIQDDGGHGMHIADGGVVTFDVGIRVNGSQIVNVTPVTTATYDLLPTDYILSVSYTLTGPVTSLTLPTAQCVDGRLVYIKDAGHMAGTNSITVDTEGAELIDGEDIYILNTNKEAIAIYSDGTNWNVL